VLGNGRSACRPTNERWKASGQVTQFFKIRGAVFGGLVDAQREDIEARFAQRLFLRGPLGEFLHAVRAPSGPEANDASARAGSGRGERHGLAVPAGGLQRARQRRRFEQHDAAGDWQLRFARGSGLPRAESRNGDWLGFAGALSQLVTSVGFEAAERLRLASWPTDFHAVDLRAVAKSHGQGLAGLRDEAAAAMQRASQRWGVAGEVDRRSCADGVAIAAGAYELQRDVVAVVRVFVLEESYAWARAVGDPEVDAAVAVPVGDGQSTAIVGQVQFHGGRHRGETRLAEVQETAVLLAPAEGAACADQAVDRRPALIVSKDCGVRGLGGG
jgi:hypothetical protein